MSLVDFLGFIITMILMFFIILRRAWQERKRDPKEKREQEANLKKFLKELDIDMEEEHEEEEEEREYAPPPKPIMVKQQYTPPPIMHVHSKIENYQTIVEERRSRASRMIDQLPSRQQMIIFQEIMNPPVSMR